MNDQEYEQNDTVMFSDENAQNNCLDSRIKKPPHEPNGMVSVSSLDDVKHFTKDDKSISLPDLVKSLEKISTSNRGSLKTDGSLCRLDLIPRVEYSLLSEESYINNGNELSLNILALEQDHIKTRSFSEQECKNRPTKFEEVEQGVRSSVCGYNRNIDSVNNLTDDHSFSDLKIYGNESDRCDKIENVVPQEIGDMADIGMRLVSDSGFGSSDDCDSSRDEMIMSPRTDANSECIYYYGSTDTSITEYQNLKAPSLQCAITDSDVMNKEEHFSTDFIELQHGKKHGLLSKETVQSIEQVNNVIIDVSHNKSAKNINASAIHHNSKVCSNVDEENEQKHFSIVHDLSVVDVSTHVTATNLHGLNKDGKPSVIVAFDDTDYCEITTNNSNKDQVMKDANKTSFKTKKNNDVFKKEPQNAVMCVYDDEFDAISSDNNKSTPTVGFTSKREYTLQDLNNTPENMVNNVKIKTGNYRYYRKRCLGASNSYDTTSMKVDDTTSTTVKVSACRKKSLPSSFSHLQYSNSYNNDVDELFIRMYNIYSAKPFKRRQNVVYPANSTHSPSTYSCKDSVVSQVERNTLGKERIRRVSSPSMSLPRILKNSKLLSVLDSAKTASVLQGSEDEINLSSTSNEYLNDAIYSPSKAIRIHGAGHESTTDLVSNIINRVITDNYQNLPSETQQNNAVFSKTETSENYDLANQVQRDRTESHYGVQRTLSLRKKAIEESLHWLRSELISLREQDKSLLRQLEKCQETIEGIKSTKSRSFVIRNEPHWEDWELEEYERNYSLPNGYFSASKRTTLRQNRKSQTPWQTFARTGNISKDMEIMV